MGQFIFIFFNHKLTRGENMPKNKINKEIKILEFYNQNGKTLTILIQEWINEKYSFGNSKIDTNKYNM